MKTLYSELGSHKLNELVNNFYDIIFHESTIAHLFQNEKDLIREKQYLFLTQFFGGPPLYSEKFGHPKLKMRHLPHSIGVDEKDEWLRCMKMAINQLNLDEQLALQLYNCFPKVAEHMRNK